jgi:hypothetical protein
VAYGRMGGVFEAQGNLPEAQAAFEEYLKISRRFVEQDPGKADWHVGEELLEQYSVGLLVESEVARVEEHVLLCGACQDKLEDIDSWVRSVRRVGAQLPQESKSLWQFWRLPLIVPALAAIVFLVFAVGVGLQITKRGAVAPFVIALEVTHGEKMTSVPA